MEDRNVYEDLEIDVENMLSPNHIQEFVDSVMAKAEELEAIMADDSTSVSKLEANVKQQWLSDKAARPQLDKYFKGVSNKLYEDGETMEPHILYGLIADLRRLAYDMENQLHDRLKMDLAKDLSPLQDKKLAQVRHKRLREAFDVYRRFVKGFFNVEVPKIKARPGNFTATLSDTLVFTYDGFDFYNPKVVSNKLGRTWVDFQDFMDWIDANPDCGVEVRKVPL